nr:hypothetical protein [Methanobrevibacter arboriphilus]
MYSKENKPELVLREHYNNMFNTALVRCYFVSFTLYKLLLNCDSDIKMLDFLHEEFYDLKSVFRIIISDNEKRGTINMLAKDFNTDTIDYYHYYDSTKDTIKSIDRLLDLKREELRKK